MGQLRKLAKLAPAEVLLLLRAWAALILITVGIRLFPFTWLQGFVARPRRRKPTPHPRVIEGLAWAMNAVGHPPLGNCLATALALQWLLSRRGVPTRLWVGVHRGVGSGAAGLGMRAHAWLEHQGRTVVGAPAHRSFTPLAHFDAVDVGAVDQSPPGKPARPEAQAP